MIFLIVIHYGLSTNKMYTFIDLFPDKIILNLPENI